MVTVVFPAYNEADLIETALREWHDDVVARIPGARLRVVTDASTDGTNRIAESLREELPRLEVVRLERNVGHGPALRRGFDGVSTDWVFQTDADRQLRPVDFWTLWDRREGRDFLFGVRSERRDSAFRKVISAALRLLNTVLWGVRLRDANAPFKLMRRDPMESVLARIPRDAFIPMVHLAVLSRVLSFRVEEVPVAHHPRKGGVASLKGIGRWGGILAGCVVELLSLRSGRPRGAIRAVVWVAAAVAVFLLGTLPYLADFPLQDWAQMGIVAPAWKLASTGIYGNDLFAGFHRTELRNYEYMPLFPLLVASSFKVFGLGVLQAKFVPVLGGLATLLLTFALGREIGGRRTGVVAAAFLVVLRLGGPPGTSGVSLVDFSRIIRYDAWVPPLVLAACWVFLRTEDCRRRLGAVGAGALIGLGTLVHVYAAFAGPVLVFVGVVREGRRFFLRGRCWGLGVGFALGVAPWLLYILGDVDAFLGQMTRHAARFALTEPSFYSANLLSEYRRYVAWAEGFPDGLLVPRLGFWFALFGLPLAWAWTTRRAWRRRRPGDLLLASAVPIIVLQFALLFTMKRHIYTIVLLPFFVLLLAGLVLRGCRLWSRRGGPPVAAAVTILIGALSVEAAWGFARTFSVARDATPYASLAERIGSATPPGRVMLSQSYWLGFSDREALSLNLLWHLSRSGSIAQTLMDLSPRAVVLERYFLDPTTEDPRASSNPEDLARWGELKQFIDAHCRLLTSIDDPSYGIIDIHRCDGAE